MIATLCDFCNKPINCLTSSVHYRAKITREYTYGAKEKEKLDICPDCIRKILTESENTKRNTDKKEKK